MVSKLSEMVTGEQVIAVIIIVLLLAYFIYKEYPEFKKRISKGEVKEKEQEINAKTLFERLDNIEKKLNELDEKLANDYDRINAMEKEQKAYRKMQKKSLQEQGIIMRALLALMDGSDEDNELVKASEKEINEYLIETAHGEEF